jgi:hypothetical protein
LAGNFFYFPNKHLFFSQVGDGPQETKTRQKLKTLIKKCMYLAV